MFHERLLSSKNMKCDKGKFSHSQRVVLNMGDYMCGNMMLGEQVAGLVTQWRRAVTMVTSSIV